MLHIPESLCPAHKPRHPAAKLVGIVANLLGDDMTFAGLQSTGEISVAAPSVARATICGATSNCHCWDFPGGPVVKNLPASSGDMGSIPG